MTQKKGKTQQAKISPEFKARLEQLGPQQQIRAIVILDIKGLEERPTGRMSSAERQAIIKAMREAAKPALLDIDTILEHSKGKRLSENVNALGSIPIEATAAGITALAVSKHVKVILEDQPISLLSATEKNF